MSKNPYADLTLLVEYLRQYQAGNKEAGIKILRTEEIQRIIGRECAKWIPSHELDELQQICYHIILKVLVRFNLPEDSNGGHIISYINKFLGKKLIDALQKLDKQHMETSFDEPITEDGMTLADILPDPSTMNMEDMVALKVDLMKAVSKLTPHQQRIVHLSFFEGMTHEEIAKKLGSSRQAVSSAMQDTLKKLRKLLT